MTMARRCRRQCVQKSAGCSGKVRVIQEERGLPEIVLAMVRVVFSMKSGGIESAIPAINGVFVDWQWCGVMGMICLGFLRIVSNV